MKPTLQHISYGIVIIILIVITILVFGATERNSAENIIHDAPLYPLTIGNTEIFVGIADNDASRAQGLSGRESLQENEGLLFVFEHPDRYGFWMRDMYFAIDMIWIDSGKQIVHIESSVEPETFPKVFRPEGDALYVLEVNAGFSEKHDIEVGDHIDFSL